MGLARRPALKFPDQQPASCSQKQALALGSTTPGMQRETSNGDQKALLNFTGQQASATGKTMGTRRNWQGRPLKITRSPEAPNIALATWSA